MKILILYLNTGSGHVTPARILSEQLSSEPPVTTVLANGFSPKQHFARALFENGYHFSSVHARASYSLFYDINTIPIVLKLTTALVNWHTSPHIARLIKKHSIDKIVCLHFAVAPAAWQAIQCVNSNIPLFVVVTDPFTAHPSWFIVKQARYIVFSEGLRREAMKKHGITDCAVFPFILKEGLSKHLPAQNSVRSMSAGAVHWKFTALIAGGGEGLPNIVPLVRYFLAHAANSSVELKIVAVCGRNKGAYRMLQKLIRRYPQLDVDIHAYVNNMPELLTSSDCVVTKAGASLIMEALASRKPLIISTYIHGQELGNVRFVVQNGAGWFIQKPKDIFDKVRFLAENASLRHIIEENIAKLDIKSDLRGIREYILACQSKQVMKYTETKRRLKWNNDTIGTIDSTNSVTFTALDYNKTVSLYTHGLHTWSPEQFIEFLSERVVSRDRRDIERILFRCGLSHYDVLQIAEITRGIHPKDLLWIAHSESECLETVATDVFDSVFHQRIDLTGDSLDTPEGYNIKRYGVYNGKYGIYKQRINQFFTDVESEVAVYHLAKKLGVPCCPAYRTDKDTAFSEFLFDFSHEYIVHFRRLFDGGRSVNEYQNLISVRPQYKDDIVRMILLDFITRQDDRHLSNIAIKIRSDTESFYPLYDNGRSLFYEDTEETVKKAVADPIKYATTFGYSGTYWDACLEIAQSGVRIESLINLNISEHEVADILKKADFSGYRFEGALKWILKAIDMLLYICSI